MTAQWLWHASGDEVRAVLASRVDDSGAVMTVQIRDRNSLEADVTDSSMMAEEGDSGVNANRPCCPPSLATRHPKLNVSVTNAKHDNPEVGRTLGSGTMVEIELEVTIIDPRPITKGRNLDGSVRSRRREVIHTDTIARNAGPAVAK